MRVNGALEWARVWGAGCAREKAGLICADGHAAEVVPYPPRGGYVRREGPGADLADGRARGRPARREPGDGLRGGDPEAGVRDGRGPGRYA